VHGLPVELRVAGLRALAIGDGGELVTKVERLVDAGAFVTVVAERPDEPIARLAEQGKLRLERRAFADADLDGAFVVFVATREAELGARLVVRARAEGRLLSTLDRPESSTFTNVAVTRAHGLSITVSSGGASPGLSRRLREDLGEALADPKLGRFVEALRALRESLPRGERARRLSAAVRGFRAALALRFPEWFERGDPPP
jgi:precorrin-2 dehydrogenase/sirohydrochlorin ferrochelatase